MCVVLKYDIFYYYIVIDHSSGLIGKLWLSMFADISASNGVLHRNSRRH